MARSWTPRPPLPNPLQGGVATDGFNLIRGRGAMCALSGIILGNPASRHGLNTSRANQNKVIRESWVTRAVTRGCAAHKLHEQPPLPGTQKHRWRGPGRGRAFPPGARGSVRALSRRQAPENPATANPRYGEGKTGVVLPACAGPFPKGSGRAQEAPWKLLGAPALVPAGERCC